MKKHSKKHFSRKVTEEQVNAMNRELDLRNADYRYSIGADGRLKETQACVELRCLCEKDVI